MPSETRRFTATLTNSSNSDAKASQGGYRANSNPGATTTSRTGYFKFTSLGALKGKVITSIKWYVRYANAGKADYKIVTFTSPSFRWTSSVPGFNNNETLTVTASNTFSPLYNAILSAINGSGTLNLTMYNGETTTKFSSDDGGSYTSNYLHINSSYLDITYTTSLPSYVFTNIRSLKSYPTAAMTANSSQSCVVSASTTYNNSYPVYYAFDNNASNCWISSKTDTAPWIQIQLPVALYDCTVTLKNRTHTTYNIGGFISGSFSGSNNGTSWTTLKSFAGRNGATSGYQNSYTLNNSTTAYKYIRCSATNFDKTENTYACVDQMTVSGYTVPSTGGWQEATAYIYTNGSWVQAAPEVYTNNAWLPG